MQVSIIIAVPNSLVQNALGSDISGPYRYKECRFPSNNTPPMHIQLQKTENYNGQNKIWKFPASGSWSV